MKDKDISIDESTFKRYGLEIELIRFLLKKRRESKKDWTLIDKNNIVSFLGMTKKVYSVCGNRFVRSFLYDDFGYRRIFPRVITYYHRVE